MPGIRWGVLGGTWIAADNEEVVALSPQNRRVLGMLLLEPGRAVVGGRLVHSGPGATPEQVANASRVAVSRLRTALGPIGAASVVVTTATGYALDVDRAAVDHVLFSKLLRESEAVEWPADALAIVDRALALWKGRPFGDLADDHAFASLAPALEEERRIAIDRWCMLSVSADLTDGVVPKLESAVGEEPFRERRWEALMLAHYRVGAQRMAIDTYDRARQMLRDELGIEPGPDLQRLLTSILDQDPALDWRPERSQQRPAGTVAIARPSALVGRDDEVADLLELLGRRRAVVVTGYGGMGKTALAAEVATRFGTASWVVPVTPTGGERVAAAVAGVMGVSGHGPDLVDRIARRLQDAAGLLVLDCCHHAPETVADLVSELLAHAPAVRVLLTSRTELSIPGAVTFALGPLATGTGEAPGPAALIAADAALIRPSQIVDHWDVVSEICRRADGVPLALELLGAAHADGADLDAPSLTGMGDVVTVAMDSLPSESRYLVNVLRVLPVDIGVTFLGELTNLGGAAVHRAMGPAVRSGLVIQAPTRETGTRARLLDPARDHLSAEAALEVVVVKDLHRTFTELAEAASPSMVDTIDTEVTSALDAEHELGLWLLDQLEEDDEALALACDLVPVWRSCGRHVDGKHVLARLESVAERSSPLVRAVYWVRRAQMSPSLADRAELIDQLSQAMEVAAANDDEELRLRAGSELIVGLGWSGQLAESGALMADLRSSAPPDNRWADLTLRGLLSMGRGMIGDPAGAAAELLEQTSEQAEIGHSGELANAFYVAAAMARMAGDADLLAQALSRAESVPLDRFSAYPMAGLAFERARQAVASDDAAAGPLLWEAYGMLEAHGERRTAATCRRELGTWRLRQGDLEGRHDLAVAAIDLLDVDPRAAAVAIARLSNAGTDDVTSGERAMLAAAASTLATSTSGLPLEPAEVTELGSLARLPDVPLDEGQLRTVLQRLADATSDSNLRAAASG